ncbi:uncharacterized protein LOC105168281 [Sesamum indicum]|uniref:Uncharacterized protein LOC105168281 n=1 Tax=Sesamum indicum TaxID=4182 RepID=A0A6I9TM61_SESIN|nr:uncharacterized protein LOC105168281 [Sesamum indicum]XP_011086601.1 uncharacterized protein LOC105168281 [Sesamum indicum]XP_011086602.1 uncharacterized protein LOC105168281 [Sesamum indicum]
MYLWCFAGYGRFHCITQLLQFLMGLGEEFDNVRQQILVMDPAPSINKGYSMIASVEKQRQAHMMGTENVAMHTRIDYKKDFRVVTRKKSNEHKRSQYCSHCERTCHTKETCFKLHRTPEWYKEMAEQRRKQVSRVKALVADNVERRIDRGKLESKDDILLNKLMKLIKSSIQLKDQVHFAQTDDFASDNYAFVSHEKTVFDLWIVYTGATNHMCANSQLLHYITPSSHPIFVHLL